MKLWFLNFIILSIGFFMHKVSLKNRNFPQETNVNESPCKITFRLFSIYDNLKCALIDSQPYIFNDSRTAIIFPFTRSTKNPLCLFAWLHTKLSEVTLLWVEFSLCAAYCPPIDFMATVTNIFRIKFRGAAERARRKLGNFPLKTGGRKKREAAVAFPFVSITNHDPDKFHHFVIINVN